MRKCRNCGEKIDEGSQFCPKCGTKIEEAAETGSKGSAGKIEGKKPFVLIGAVVLIVVVLLFALLRPKYMTIVPTEYVKVSCRGLNGSGTAKPELDAASLQAAIAEEKNLKPAQQNELESLLSQAGTYITLSQDTDLSNGDSIKIQCSMPSDYLEAYHVKLKSDDYSYTVSGLTDVQTVKLEDYCTVSFYGFEEHGYASYYLEPEQLYQDISEMIRAVDDSPAAETYISEGLYSELFYNGMFRQEISPSEGLSNGDTVTCICEIADVENQLEKYGIVFEASESEQKAEGLETLETLDVQEYVQVSFEGYDGAGYASVYLDEERLAADLAEKFPDGRGDCEAEYLGEVAANYLDNGMDWSIEPKNGLANGDTVQIQITGKDDDNYLGSVGFVMEDVDKTVTAEGLDAPQEVDLTEILQIEFSGITPDVSAEVKLDNESPLIAYLDYDSISEIPRHLTAYNGDGIDVTLGYDEGSALYDGYRIVNDSKHYEIKGLDTYDFSLESTMQENLVQLVGEQKEEAVRLILREENTLLQTLEAGSVQILWSRVKLGLQKIVKLYSEDGNAYNRMVLVYKAVIPMMAPDETVSRRDIYVMKIFEDVSEAEDGTLSWEWDETEYFYESEEAVSEFLNQLAEETWEDECVRTEAVNEDLESELLAEEKDDPEQAAKQDDQEQAAEQDDQAQAEAGQEAEKSNQEAISQDTQKTGQNEETGKNGDVTVTEAQLQELQGLAASEAELDGHRYFLFDEVVTWKEAKKLCEQTGGALATVNGWPEQAVLQSLIQAGELEHYWIGASDEEAEGAWSWVTGEEFSCAYWDSYQPDNADGAEDYAVISRSFGNKWNDYPEDREDVGYILELPCEEPQGGLNLVDSKTLRNEKDTSYDVWADDTYGDTHYGAILFHASAGGWAQYELNGAYSRLGGEISVYSEADTGDGLDIAVFGDGKLLWSKCGITREMKAASFDADVSGVQSVAIMTRSPGSSDNGWLILDHAKLHGGQTETASDKASRLSGLYVIDGREFSQASGLNRDTDGELHDGYTEFYAGGDASAAWNLDGRYTSFEGKIVTYNRTGADVSMNVRIYGDNELLFEEDGISKRTGTLPFTLDVTGVRVLRIETEDTSETRDAWLYLVDDVLGKEAADSKAEEDAEPKTDETINGGDDAEETAAAVFTEVPANVTALASCMVQYGARSYYVIETPTVWENAERFCEQMGGHLAVISSPLVEAQIRNLLEKASGNGYWIGATDKEQEGEWLWVTGEPMDYANWCDSNPDDYDSENGGEDYLEIYRDGGWNDNDAEEMLGFIMEFSSETRSSDEVELAQFQYAGNAWDGADQEYLWKAADVYGEEHLSCYRLNTSYGGWLTCSLNGAYETIRGMVVPSSGANQNARMSIAVFGDGRLLCAETEIGGWSAGLPFEADVTGVRTLTIRTSNTGDSGELLLADTVLCKAQEPSLTGRAAALGELQLIDAGAFESHARLFRDSYGKVYDGDMSFHASEEGYALYLLGGKYTEFSGIIAPSNATGADSSMSVKIYADDELIFEEGGITRMTEAIPFSLDVTGTENLKIVTSDAEEAYDGYVYVTEDALK